METLQIWFWFIVEKAIWGLPWVAIALASLMTLKDQKRSRALGLQAIGAVSFLALMVLNWVVLWTLGLFHTIDYVYTAVATIFNFLEFVALSTFALGFCWEKWILHRAHITAEKAQAAANKAGIIVSANPSPPPVIGNW